MHCNHRLVNGTLALTTAPECAAGFAVFLPPSAFVGARRQKIARSQTTAGLQHGSVSTIESYDKKENMDTFLATCGAKIEFASPLDQVKSEHILQSERSAWRVIPEWPYLAIDRDRVDACIGSLERFSVFSSGQLWQNIRKQDLGARLLGGLIGGGTNAGFGPESRAFVEGKANAKANVLMNWNPALIVGSTPWCAEGTHFIFVDNGALYQHKFAELVVDDGPSYPRSEHFDFAALIALRNRFQSEYLQRREGGVDLEALEKLLDDTFAQNASSLSAATAYHETLSNSLTSLDYEAPVLTRYDRPTHDASGQPKIEVSFALLHYERAIVSFNALKACQGSSKIDEAFSNGVYCVVAVAACIEAIANKLVFLESGAHPTHKDRRTPLAKLNDAASRLCQRRGIPYVPLAAGDPIFDALDVVRWERNGFMHAKELETDIDPVTLSSAATTAVSETNCHNYLQRLREGVDKVFSQLPNIASPIVTRTNVRWMGDLEVP